MPAGRKPGRVKETLGRSTIKHEGGRPGIFRFILIGLITSYIVLACPEISSSWPIIIIIIIIIIISRTHKEGLRIEYCVA